ASGADLDIEPTRGADQFGQLGVTIGALVEIGVGVAQPTADAPHRYPAVAVFVHIGDGLGDQTPGFGRFAASGGGGRRRGLVIGLGRRDRQVLGIDEAGAGLTEALGRLLLAEAVDRDALLADARRQ